MKKKLLIALGSLVGLIVLALVAVLIYGATRPREHTAQGDVTIAAPPTEVWDVLMDIDALPEWMEGIESVELLETDDNGLRTYRETASWGTVTFRETAAVPPEHLVIEVAEAEGWGGTWTYTLTATDDGTLLSVREEGFVDNPFFRAMMHMMGTDTTINTVLAATKARVEAL